MSLRAPESVQKFQTALHAKAKEMPSYRFYALYDKLYREDILAHAWWLANANGGAAGVDGQTFQDIEEYGVERWLSELAEDLRKKTYRPQPARRVYIPKPDGRKRPHDPGQGGPDGGRFLCCRRSLRPTCNRRQLHIHARRAIAKSFINPLKNL